LGLSFQQGHRSHHMRKSKPLLGHRLQHAASQRLLGIALWAAVSLCVLSACQDDSDCSSANSTTVLVSFLDSASGSALSLTFDSVYAPATGITILNDTNAVSSVSLPIDPFNTNALYLLVNDTVVDSLAVTYSLRSRVITPSCGTELVVTALAIDSTLTSYDSAVVANDFLNEFLDVNINLYLAQ